MKNPIKKEFYLSTQIDNLMKQIEYEDFEDFEDMKNHIKKLHNNILLLVKVIDFVYK